MHMYSVARDALVVCIYLSLFDRVLIMDAITDVASCLGMALLCWDMCKVTHAHFGCSSCSSMQMYTDILAAKDSSVDNGH